MTTASDGDERKVENKRNATSAPFWPGGEKWLQVRFGEIGYTDDGEQLLSVHGYDPANHNRPVFHTKVHRGQKAALISAIENGSYESEEVSNANAGELCDTPDASGNVVVIPDPGPTDPPRPAVRPVTVFRVKLRAG